MRQIVVESDFQRVTAPDTAGAMSTHIYNSTAHRRTVHITDILFNSPAFRVQLVFIAVRVTDKKEWRFRAFVGAHETILILVSRMHPHTMVRRHSQIERRRF